MLSDYVISLQNGYENRTHTIKTILNKKYYEGCIKYGVDIHPQLFKYSNEIVKFNIIPIAILFDIPCLIGLNSVIDLEALNIEIKRLKRLDIDVYKNLYIYEDAYIKINEKKYIVKNFFLRSYKLFEYYPNTTSLYEFIDNKSMLLFEGANGINCQNGDPYDMLSDDYMNKNTNILGVYNPKYIGTIYGITNIFEIYSNINKPNVTALSDIIKYTDNIYFKTNNTLFYYNWLNLDTLIERITLYGINVLYINGLNLLKDLDIFEIIVNDSHKTFLSLSEYKRYIRTELINIKTISDIIFIY